MNRAYIQTDPLEDSEVLNSLMERLSIQGLTPTLTDKNWKDIWDPEPFLFFRNAYIRFPNEKLIIEFHSKNKDFRYICSKNGEIVSVSSTGKENTFNLNNIETTYYEPKIEPLPILLGAGQRPLYFRVALNSILANIKSSRQKLYIIASKPDEETKKIVEESLKYSFVEAVISDNNLKYAFSNFGTKFFGLKKFILHEDDGILPENTHYHLPFWTSQLNHRSTTADLVGFRIFEGNWRPDFFVSSYYHNNKLINLPTKIISYIKPQLSEITPLGGMGVVIDSELKHRNYSSPTYCTTDSSFIKAANSICFINLPIYHIGANYMMDYPDYSQNKMNTDVDQFQTGTNMRTKQSKTIDLLLDWNKGL